MRGQAGFWNLDERYQRLSASGDPLEKLNAIIARDVFDKPLAKALKRPEGAKGGRPAHAPVLMFKILVLQALYSLSDDRAEFVIADRLGRDPAMRWIVGGRAVAKQAASTSQMGRFETEFL